jgi:hypothetical protein
VPGLEAKLRLRQSVVPLGTAFAFLLSVGVAFLSADAAKLCWVLIGPVSLYLIRDL